MCVHLWQKIASRQNCENQYWPHLSLARGVERQQNVQSGELGRYIFCEEGNYLKTSTFLKVTNFGSQKMGLWVSETTIPQNGAMDTCFVHLPLLSGFLANLEI